jgi:hypothetical protein
MHPLARDQLQAVACRRGGLKVLSRCPRLEG